MMENFELDKILFDLKIDIVVEGTHEGSVIIDSWKSSTQGVLDLDISPEFHLPRSLCRSLFALFWSFLSLASIVEYLNFYWFLSSVEFQFERWQIRFFLPSACADDPPGEDFSKPCCEEVCLVRVSFAPKEKYEWTPSVFKFRGTVCPKKLIVVVRAFVLVFWTSFDRWFVTVCHFLSLSLVSLSISMVSSIFIAALSLACCPVALSSVRLTALTIIFDPLFG